MSSSLFRLTKALLLASLVLTPGRTMAIPTPEAPTSTSPPSASASLLYQFPNGTWLENIRVRPNGHLLISRVDQGSLYTLDPHSKPHSTPKLVHTFPNNVGVFGAAEVSPDVWAIATGGYDLTTAKPRPNSFSVWKVDFTSSSNPIEHSKCQSPSSLAKVSKLADIPQAILLNGAAPSKSGRYALFADSGAGRIFRVDISTGKVDVPLADKLLEVPADASQAIPIGVNGLNMFGDYLYYTNLGAASVGRVKVSGDGEQAGGYEVFVNGTGLVPDDLTVKVNEGGEVGVYVCDFQGARIVEVREGGVQKVVVEDKELLAKVTAVRFGRGKDDGHVLYASTGAGLVVAVKV